MKIVTKEAVYVEKYDLAFLNGLDCDIPSQIFLKAFKDQLYPKSNETNNHEFVRYEELSDIEFLRRYDWIVDYNQIRNLSKKKIRELIDGLIAQRNLAAEVYFAMSIKEQRKKRHIINEYALFNFKIRSIREAYNIAHGKIHVDLPIDIDDHVIEEPKDTQGFLSRIRKNKN